MKVINEGVLAYRDSWRNRLYKRKAKFTASDDEIFSDLGKMNLASDRKLKRKYKKISAKLGNRRKNSKDKRIKDIEDEVVIALASLFEYINNEKNEELEGIKIAEGLENREKCLEVKKDLDSRFDKSSAGCLNIFIIKKINEI